MDISKLLLTEEDFKGLGVSAQSNPMELPEEQAKAVFDQLVKEVITPRINAILQELAAIDLTADAKKPVSEAQQEALDKKVNRELRTGSEAEEKVLSDNNYDDTEKENVRLNTEKRHGHDNKAVLDSITEQDYRNWNGENVLTKDNTEPFTPTGEYQPATKAYVDNAVLETGAADMTQAVYDPKGRKTDIFKEIDDVAAVCAEQLQQLQDTLMAAAAASRILTDEETRERYTLGVKSGALYYRKVEVE